MARKLSSHMPANELEAKIQTWFYGKPLGPITPLPKDVAPSTQPSNSAASGSTGKVIHIEISITGIRLVHSE